MRDEKSARASGNGGREGGEWRERSSAGFAQAKRGATRPIPTFSRSQALREEPGFALNPGARYRVSHPISTMKFFVTGGAGYIGSICVEQLLDAGHQVTVFDNLTEGHRQGQSIRARN